MRKDGALPTPRHTPEGRAEDPLPDTAPRRPPASAPESSSLPFPGSPVCPPCPPLGCAQGQRSPLPHSAQHPQRLGPCRASSAFSTCRVLQSPHSEARLPATGCGCDNYRHTALDHLRPCPRPMSRQFEQVLSVAAWSCPPALTPFSRSPSARPPAPAHIPRPVLSPGPAQ